MPIPALDAVDLKILRLLQDDGRMSLADLAGKVGLSPSPCLRRVRLLEKSGVISRYVAVLDQRAVGLPVSVFISVKLEKQREELLDRFAKTIARWPEVLECYLMTGPRDYWLRVVVPDLAAYERFLKQKLTRLEASLRSNRVSRWSRSNIPTCCRSHDYLLSVARLVFLSGASSTVLQAGGNSASIVCLTGGLGLICGCSTLSENQ